MKGLYQKYTITKTSGKELDPDFEAIVLRIDGGRYLEASLAGVRAFAEAVRRENNILADDIEKRLQELAVEDTILEIKDTPLGNFFG